MLIIEQAVLGFLCSVLLLIAGQIMAMHWSPDSELLALVLARSAFEGLLDDDKVSQWACIPLTFARSYCCTCTFNSPA
jgi:hypothetical protein